MANEKRLIDANAFEEYHCNGCPYRQEGSCTNDDPICATIDDLREAPTVDAVEVVHGRWKAHKPDCRGYTAGFICSHCGYIIYTDYCMKECEYNYCPNCGAKMDGDGNA